jgi:APA family basic amino acid/polyamine antiporter
LILFIWYSRNTVQENWYVTWGPFLMAGAAFLLGIPVHLSTRSRMTEPPPIPALPLIPVYPATITKNH